jgi:hypothetical protein
MGLRFDYSARNEAFLDVEDLNLNLNSKKDQEELLRLMKFTIVETALDARAKEEAKGFDKKALTLVDNRAGKQEIQVKPYGTIEYVARGEIKEIALAVYKKILKLSREDTGLYKSLNYVFFNGEQIATTFSELENWFRAPRLFQDRDRIRFMNIAPYAQKLELQGATSSRVKSKLGKSKDKKLRSGPKVRKPNGTYFLTQRQLSRKFKGNVFMKFQLLPGNYVGVTSPIPPNSKQSFRADYDPKGKFNSGYYIYPTIVLSLSEQGLNI